MSTVQRLLWLADFFKVDSLTEHCIKSLIIPKLSKDNVIDFLEDSYTKVTAANSSDSLEVWNLLIDQCLDLTAKNIQYLARINKERLMKQSADVIEEVADRAYKSFMTNMSADNSPITELLMHTRNTSCPFEMLEGERKRVLEKEKAYFTSEHASPNLTWSLSRLSGSFYKESEPFFVLGCYWVLSIWNYKEDGTVFIAIKQSKTPKEVEELLNSTLKDTMNPAKKAAEGEAAQGKIPNHCILTVATFASIHELDKDNEGIFQLASLISASKVPTTIRILTMQDLERTNGQITIDIYLKLEYTHSGILTYISKNFSWLYNTPGVGLMTRNQFLTLLKHKYLNVKWEEEVLVALCIWSIPNVNNSGEKQGVRYEYKGLAGQCELGVHTDEQFGGHNFELSSAEGQRGFQTAIFRGDL
eukprot:TRINITY_DN11600_c0_g1_i2.p1 TRINITY_DN11600_c0_g1~~TRINITY_DN11600_c0_g1_i2.p1  ORF type:complete len:416 (-),score=93.91 TRINITY_DN11600_c0_g1_i2:313-1560(-)